MWRLILALGVVLSLEATAQDGPRERTLPVLFDDVVHTMVRIEVGTQSGTGWLLQQSTRPLVVTNKHVVQQGQVHRVEFYQGTNAHSVVINARVVLVSEDIDLAILRLERDPPASAQAHALRMNTTIRRGERIVLGGNPAVPGGFLPFQTTAGVVTGHVTGQGFEACGAGRNCVVIDAASLGGSSGGPAFNMQGELVGMLWGGPTQQVRSVVGGVVQNPSFSYLIHARTLAVELRRFER